MTYRALLCAGCLLFAPLRAGAATLEQIAQAHFAAKWRDDPVLATRAGIHADDSRLNDVSAPAMAATIRRLHAEQVALAGLDTARLAPLQRDERQILQAAIGGELLQDETIQPQRHNPDIYVGLAGRALYTLINRDYAPLPQRLRAVIARERAIPAMLKTGEAQLTAVPQIYIDIAQANLAGAVGLVATGVPAVFAAVPDRSLQTQLAASTKASLAAFAEYKAFLARLTPGGTFVLGPGVMRGLLAEDLVDLPIDAVVAAGQAQMARDKAAFLATERLIDPAHPDDAIGLVRRAHPTADTLIATASGQLAALQRFVVAHHIVTLPAMTLPSVIETPAFRRATTSAAMDWPGPFETRGLTSFYDITPPPADDTPAQVEQTLSFLNDAQLEIITAHEAMPGHFVQGLFMRAHPDWSLIRKAAQSYTTIEGWAHYTEQMMVDEGFGGGDPKLRLMQLQAALLRDCRLIVAFGLHAQGMSLDDAQRVFERDSFLPPLTARLEVRRGSEDPGYFAYTLGKLMILHLRSDMQKQQGAAFSLTRFHDTLLAAGLVPMKTIRHEMTGRDDPLL